MNSKFENLNDELFNEQIEKNQMAKVTGGRLDSMGDDNTYVGENGDHVGYVDDEKGNVFKEEEAQDGWV